METSAAFQIRRLNVYFSAPNDYTPLYRHLNTKVFTELHVCFDIFQFSVTADLPQALIYAKTCSFASNVTEMAVINNTSAESEGRFNSNSCFTDYVWSVWRCLSEVLAPFMK